MSKSTSFIQGERHLTKSARFQPIKPEGIATVLADHGFDMVSLRTGHAKNEDRRDHQTTVAIYRSRDQFEVKGLHFDLTFKVPHLYGSLVAYMGLFRLVCLNGLIAGRNFEQMRIKHLGNPYEQINQLIPSLVAQRTALVSEVTRMQSIQLNEFEMYHLARQVAIDRLESMANIIHVEYADLLERRRNHDTANDLFTVLNVIQENSLRHGFRYVTAKLNQDGTTLIERNMSTRRVKETSVNAIGITQGVWTHASKLLSERIGT